MDYDLRGELARLTDEPVEGENDLPLTETANRLRRGRTVRTTAVTLVGAAAAVAVAFSVQAIGPRQAEPATPAQPTETTEPIPTSTPKQAPEPDTDAPDLDSTPTEPVETPPAPVEAFSPALEACGTLVETPDPWGDVWVGSYWGGADAEPGAPMELAWAVIVGEDWSDRQVTAVVEALWIVSPTGSSTSAVSEDGVTILVPEPAPVAAVPAEELPDPFPVLFRPGSEGGGGGSEGLIELTIPVVACPDGAGELPIGTYGAAIEVTLDDGTSTRSVRGATAVHVGGEEAATAGS